MKTQIPTALLIPPPLNLSEAQTQRDVGLMMIDLYEAYTKCTLQLKAIKEIDNE